MKFKKTLTIELPEFKLEKKYWDKIDSFCEKRVNLPKEDPKIYTELADTDCILTGFGIRVDKDIIDKAPNLKYIAPLATGYGGVDVEYAKSKKITVCNIPGYAANAVAEFVIASLLDQARQLDKGKSQVRQGNYSEGGFSPWEIKGKIFSILGMGRNGQRTAELAKCFGAEVRYWSRNRKPDVEKNGVVYQDVEKLINESDILSLHLLLNKETEFFMNAKRLMSLKSGAILINTSPMELVEISALESRLAKKDITFIEDHTDEMKKEDIDKLIKYDNCIMYPPIGYCTKEASVAKQEIFVSNIENLLKGKPLNKVS